MTLQTRDFTHRLVDTGFREILDDLILEARARGMSASGIMLAMNERLKKLTYDPEWWPVSQPRSRDRARSPQIAGSGAAAVPPQ